MLIVLAAPSIHDSYYKKYFTKMIDFYVLYATAIQGHDEVIVLADKSTMPYLEKRLQKEILLTVEEQLDPWIRDVSPVNPHKNILFHYSGGLKKKEAKTIQSRFISFLKRFEIQYTCFDLVNDGGNFVYDYNQTLITSDKILKLNKINEEEAIKLLEEAFGIDRVIILPADDEKLGHIDGMCSLVSDNNAVFVDYSEEDHKFDKIVLKSLHEFTSEFKHLDFNFVKVKCPFNDKTAPGGFVSSSGIYVNCVPTENFIYVPIFNHPQDEPALKLFQSIAGHKKIIPVDATAVCDLGGSLRCLSWEVTGNNAVKLINAAKSNSPI